MHGCEARSEAKASAIRAVTRKRERLYLYVKCMCIARTHTHIRRVRCMAHTIMSVCRREHVSNGFYMLRAFALCVCVCRPFIRGAAAAFGYIKPHITLAHTKKAYNLLGFLGVFATVCNVWVDCRRRYRRQRVVLGLRRSSWEQWHLITSSWRDRMRTQNFMRNRTGLTHNACCLVKRYLMKL